MEGIVCKWTNYWTGWQPRWFVLADGVMSYYKSQEDRCNQSCKGSIKMSVCEIIVHPTDANRLDLVIPSEQHFYLRLATPQERQQWLVALGSAKATLGPRLKKKPADHSTSSPGVTTGASPDVLKSKTCELRLYCDLLMQQVHMVKTAVTDKSPPDIEVLDSASSLLGATCDTFIKALEECMIVANASSLSSSGLNHDSSAKHRIISSLDSTLMASSTKGHVKKMQPSHKSKSAERSASPSSSPMLRDEEADWQNNRQELHLLCSVTDTETESSIENDDEDDEGRTTGNEEFEDAQETHELDNRSSKSESTTSSSNNSNYEKRASKSAETKLRCNGEDSSSTPLVVEKCLPDGRIKTFFSNLEVSFLNMKLTKDGGIPTKHFLESCAIVITIFEMFGSPIFAPMKMDVNGNLKKINDKYKMNSERFFTLQSIIHYEMDTGTTLSKNSATDAIMWLKRGLEFVYEFLREFHRGNMDLKLCALNAYNRTLKQYHGWIVRNVISTATRTVPSRQEVMLKLALHPEDVHNVYYEEELVLDAQRFTKAMDVIIRILKDFYFRHRLEGKAPI